MDIKRSCTSSPFTNNIQPSMFTPRDRPPPKFPIESNDESTNSNLYTLNLTPIMNIDTPDKPPSLDEQVRLERDIAHESSVLIQDSFVTTYSSLQTIFSQIQLKLSSVFIQETEYLQQREQRLEEEEQILTKRIKQIQQIEIERKQMEQEFSKIKDRLEIALIQIMEFKTNGAEILRILFSESRQIDEELSGLISQCMASLVRSRSMIDLKKSDFLQKSDHIRSELTDREVLIRNTQVSVTLIFELINTLNQLNIEHSQDLTRTSIDFHKKYQQFTDLSETTKNNWDIEKEMNQIRLLEKEKIQLENELLEQTLLLENICTIIDKTIII